MARSVRPIAVLQFDPRAMALLRVRPSSAGVDAAAHIVERGAWPAEDGSLAAALADFAKRHALADADVYTVVPRHEVTARVLTLPSQDPAEIASMVRLSAEEYVPYSVEELAIAQAVLRKLPGGESSVLAVFAHRDVVQSHLALLGQAGIVPTQIYLGTACLAAALAAAAPRDEEPVGLLWMGSAGIEVLVAAGGALRYTRGVASERDWAAQGEEAAAALEELALEVRGSLSAYRRESEDGLAVERVLVATDGFDAAPWCDALEAETGKPCQPAPLPEALVAPGSARLEGRPYVALGAALAAQGRAAAVVALLPASVAAERKLQGLRARALRAAAAAAAVAAALGALYAQAVWQRQSYIAELERQRAALEPNARGVAAKQEELMTLRRHVELNGSALEFLGGLCLAAPPGGLNFTRIGFERASGLEVWGRALERDGIHAFAERLRGMKQTLSLFAQARSVYEDKGVEQGENIFLYQISLPNPEEEPNAGRTRAKAS